MIELITKDQAYDHLRLDHDSDAWLDMFIPVVSEAVALWLKESWRLYEWEVDSDGAIVRDSDDNPVPLTDIDDNFVVRRVVQAACIVELASMNRFREGEGKDNMVPADAGHGYMLNKASTALLASLRKPTAA